MQKTPLGTLRIMTILAALKPVRSPLTALFLTAILLLSPAAGTILINPVAAEFSALPTITIRSDGTVEPKTDFIKQDGAAYTLTADVIRKYAIVIQCSNIVFDGEGRLKKTKTASA